MNNKIHSSVGVYPNPHALFKFNGVAPEDLESHIEYNRKWRPGRALFVDGKCVLKGSLSDERITEVEHLLAEDPHTPNRCTAPYC